MLLSELNYVGKRAPTYAWNPWLIYKYVDEWLIFATVNPQAFYFETFLGIMDSIILCLVLKVANIL